MARVMLVSLGTGPSVEHGIAASIRIHRPERVVFFATEKSEPTEAKVKALLKQCPPTETIHISNENDPNEIYRKASEKLQQLQREGIKLSEDVFCDFTSGTKVMSAGLVAAALVQGVHQLVYVSGQRDADGRVVSGTEQVITIIPAEMLADRLKQQVILLFNKRLFGAALQLIEQGLAESHLPEHRRDLDDLKVLCLAYQAWDWFDHQQAAEHFQKLNKEMIERWSKKIADNKGWVCELVSKLEPTAPIEERYPQELLIDLWLNAQRRIEEGHWIDATARLYRLTELIAQYRLSRLGWDASLLETDKLPKELQANYEGLRDEEGHVKLGLKQAFELLKDLGDPLGQCYDQKLRDALRARNESIGGHGLKAVTEGDCGKLLQAVQRLLDQAVPMWKKQVERAHFAQL